MFNILLKVTFKDKTKEVRMPAMWQTLVREFCNQLIGSEEERGVNVQNSFSVWENRLNIFRKSCTNQMKEILARFFISSFESFLLSIILTIFKSNLF